MTGSSHAIATRDLSRRYGSTTAVRSLDLQVSRGAIYGFLGPNGAGKTTTMQMLTGLLEPSAGEAWVAGTPVGDRREVVQHVGLLPEEPPLYDQLTGREQLQFAADLRELPWDAVADRALGVCETLDLDDLDRRIEGYSKGMRQKVAFAQAVFHDPDVVFLDEPTAGLDPRAAKALRELIVELATADVTVFLSTHVLPVVEEIADEVGVLYDGRIVAEGSPGGLSRQVEEAAVDETASGDGTGPGDADLEDAFLELTAERDGW